MLLALIPAISAVAIAFIAGIFQTAHKRAESVDKGRTEAEGVRQELLANQRERIAMLIQERDEARSTLEKARTDVTNLEGIIAKMRPTRGQGAEQ